MDELLYYLLTIVWIFIIILFFIITISLCLYCKKKEEGTYLLQ